MACCPCPICPCCPQLSVPVPLPATEVDAIAAYKASSSEGLQPCLTLLEQAARDKSVKPELVEGALAYLEANHGARRRQEQLHGQQRQWQCGPRRRIAAMAAIVAGGYTEPAASS